MSYFTCEVHQLQFLSIQALKDHVAKIHTDENKSSIKRPSTPKVKKAQISTKSVALSKEPLPQTSTPTTIIPIIRPLALPSPSNKIQCHICEQFCSSSKHLEAHLETHFKDNLLPTFPNKTEAERVKIKAEKDITSQPIKIKDDIRNYVDDDAFGEDEGEESSDDNDKNDPDFSPPPDIEMNEDEVQENIALSLSKRTGENSKKIVAYAKKGGKHIPRTHFCTLPGCNKAFSDKHKLKEHVSRHTGENKPYHCTWKGCDNKFPRCNELKLHYRKHTGEKPTNNFTCSCGRCHIRNHKHLLGYKPHLLEGTILVCYFCGYIPRQVNLDFDAHMFRHTLERPYRCKICNRLCHNEEGLEKHGKKHTAKDMSERRHKCVECGSRFTSGSALRKHRPTHSTDRPFACRVCSSSFKIFRDLKRHFETVHRCKSKYKCEICPGIGKEFARRDFFKFHMKTTHPGVEFAEPGPQFDRRITNDHVNDNYVITCMVCKIKFNDNAKFLQHQRKCSKTIKPSTETSKNQKKKKQRKELLENKEIKPGESMIKNGVDYDDDDNSEKMFKDNEDKSSTIIKLKCKVCDGRLFNSEDSLKSHMQIFH